MLLKSLNMVVDRLKTWYRDNDRIEIMITLFVHVLEFTKVLGGTTIATTPT